MMKDIGVNWALTGHSERRTKNGTTDQDVAMKTKVAIENEIMVIIFLKSVLVISKAALYRNSLIEQPKFFRRGECTQSYRARCTVDN